MGYSSASWVAVFGPCSARFTSRLRRIGSASAAKTGASVTSESSCAHHSLSRLYSNQPSPCRFCEAHPLPQGERLGSDMVKSAYLRDLDQVAAGVIEYSDSRWTHRHRFTPKLYAQLYHAFVLFVNVVNRKGRYRNFLFKQRLLERLGCWIVIRLQQKLCAIELFG